MRSEVQAGAEHRPRIRRSAVDRRRMIVDAARATILEYGLAETSVRTIAHAAGVSIGTVTHHFASVDEILIEVIRTVLREFYAELMARTAEAGSALDGLIVNAEMHMQAREQGLIWVEYWARSPHTPKVRAWQARFYAGGLRAIRDLIEDGVARGEFAPVDAERVALEYLAIMDGLTVQVLVSGRMDEHGAVDVLLRFLEHRLGVSIPPR